MEMRLKKHAQVLNIIIRKWYLTFIWIPNDVVLFYNSFVRRRHKISEWNMIIKKFKHCIYHKSFNVSFKKVLKNGGNSTFQQFLNRDISSCTFSFDIHSLCVRWFPWLKLMKKLFPSKFLTTRRPTHTKTQIENK